MANIKQGKWIPPAVGASRSLAHGTGTGKQQPLLWCGPGTGRVAPASLVPLLISKGHQGTEAVPEKGNEKGLWGEGGVLL